jgi:ribosomal protein S18 acetylase RimI-like enzyme
VTTVRPARLADDATLRQIDRETWTSAVSPSPPPPEDAPFFRPGAETADVIVAEVQSVVAGYVSLHQALPIVSHAHVLEVGGLAVAPAFQGRGIARALVEEVKAEAGRRGARKLSLRVLAPNAPARRLYEACGFRVEGILSEEFLLDGAYVDDVLMACPLT